MQWRTDAVAHCLGRPGQVAGAVWLPLSRRQGSFASQSEGCAAGGQNAQLWAAPQEVVGQPCARFEEKLEVPGAIEALADRTTVPRYIGQCAAV